MKQRIRCKEEMAPVAPTNNYAEVDPTGRYGRFDEVLGRGAMKTVYRAFDELTGIEVAWNKAKLLGVQRSPEVLEHLKREVDLLRTLHHESIIKLHTSWINPYSWTFNFITEMFTSGTLREYRKKYPKMNIRAIKNWARQILQGLDYLHRQEKPVIHRDLKCDNIFINGNLGQVKIGDLGLATVLKGPESCHTVIGTPEFMAPELFREDYNELIDVYSFGMCMLEMLTGEFPYKECCDVVQIYKSVTSGILPSSFYRVQDLQARHFVSRCLQAVSKRPSAAELLRDPFLAIDNSVLVDPKTFMPNPINSDNMPNGQDPAVMQEFQGRASDGSGMRITGTQNSETISLEVHIPDKEGKVKNISFEFNIGQDTPISVANEMVKELNITDHDPLEIAGMIEHEVVMLTGWTVNGHTYVHEMDPDAPYHALSSPSCSSRGSPNGLSRWPSWYASCHPDHSVTDEDDKCSVTSSLYSASRDSGPELVSPEGKPPTVNSSKIGKWQNILLNGRGPIIPQMADIRSQILKNKKLDGQKQNLWTVGAMEGIGFHPPDIPRDGESSSATSAGERRKTKQKGKK